MKNRPVAVIIFLLVALVGALLGRQLTLSGYGWTFNVGAKAEQPESQPAWKHDVYTDGNLAAGWLTSMNCAVGDVYAATSLPNIHVWCRPGRVHVHWEYKYVNWTSDPTAVPLPDKDANHVPIGFGSANGKTVFLFFIAQQ